MGWIGPAISAGVNLAGSALGMSQAEQNADLQREFAQKGIRWKVRDAQAAGIHPLYALGAQTHSFQPVSAGDTLGSLSNMGQDISRAVEATRTAPEKQDQTLRMLQLERAHLENQLIRSQIAQNALASRTPPMAMAGDPYLMNGQTSSGLIKDSPMKRTMSSPTNPAQEPGAIPGVGWERTESGGLAPVPSADVKQRIEDMIIPEMMWSARQLLAPNFGGGSRPPQSLLKPGFVWEWDYTDQSWKQVRNPVSHRGF